MALVVLTKFAALWTSYRKWCFLVRAHLQVPAGGKEAITPLVRVLWEAKQIVRFMRAVAEHEMRLTSDATTLFRGNSLLSRCVDEFMKLVGMNYLQNTLRPLIDRVLAEKKPCEIDPTKLTDSTRQLPINTHNLKVSYSLDLKGGFLHSAVVTFFCLLSSCEKTHTSSDIFFRVVL